MKSTFFLFNFFFKLEMHSHGSSFCLFLTRCNLSHLNGLYLCSIFTEAVCLFYNVVVHYNGFRLRETAVLTYKTALS